MGVYVDPQTRCLMSNAWRWTTSCHLFADSLEELHEFAASIGLRRQWYQLSHGIFPHYDLNESRRAKAVAKGVMQLTRAEAVEIWRRNGWTRRTAQSVQADLNTCDT